MPLHRGTLALILQTGILAITIFLSKNILMTFSARGQRTGGLRIGLGLV